MTSQINLFDLPIPQLQAVGQQLEEEIQILSQSFGKLKQAQIKFADGMESLKKVEKSQGKKLLVPLTNSLYVDGELCETDKVIVDIGTGYFAEKTIPDAQSHYKRKVEFIKQNLMKLEETVNQRRDQKKGNLAALTDSLDFRVAAKIERAATNREDRRVLKI